MGPGGLKATSEANSQRSVFAIRLGHSFGFQEIERWFVDLLGRQHGSLRLAADVP
jgi:hypothetical protein